MNAWPPQPGLTVMQSARSTLSATSRVDLERRRRADREARREPGVADVRERVVEVRRRLGVDRDRRRRRRARTRRAGARGARSSGAPRAAPPAAPTRSRSAATTSGPIVIGGTKCPSMTSTWITRAPASSTSCTCSPSRSKSAARIDGATRGARQRAPASYLPQHAAAADVAHDDRGARHPHDRRVLAAVRAHRDELEAVQAVDAAVAARAGSSGAATARRSCGQRVPSSAASLIAQAALSARSAATKKPSLPCTCAEREQVVAARAGAPTPGSAAAGRSRRTPGGHRGTLRSGARSRPPRSCTSSRRACPPARTRRPRRTIAGPAARRAPRTRSGARAPAQVGARLERAEARARRVERARARSARRARRGRVASPTSTVTFAAPIRSRRALQRPRAAGVALDRDDLAARRPSAPRGASSCRPARRTGRARARRAAASSAWATSIDARDCGISSPARHCGEPCASNGSSAITASGGSPGTRRRARAQRRRERRRVGPQRVGAQRALGRLVGAREQRPRRLRRRAPPTTARRSSAASSGAIDAPPRDRRRGARRAAPRARARSGAAPR